MCMLCICMHICVSIYVYVYVCDWVLMSVGAIIHVCTSQFLCACVCVCVLCWGRGREWVSHACVDVRTYTHSMKCFTLSLPARSVTQVLSYSRSLFLALSLSPALSFFCCLREYLMCVHARSRSLLVHLYFTCFFSFALGPALQYAAAHVNRKELTCRRVLDGMWWAFRERRKIVCHDLGVLAPQQGEHDEWSSADCPIYTTATEQIKVATEFVLYYFPTTFLSNHFKICCLRRAPDYPEGFLCGHCRLQHPSCLSTSTASIFAKIKRERRVKRHKRPLLT